MAVVHRVLGFGVVGALALVFLVGVGLRLARREEAPNWFWVLEHYVENLLVLQVVVGVVLFAIGRRVEGGDLVWFHYLYGSLFPAIAIIAGRVSGLRRETHEYMGVAWGALIAWGLTARALTMGLGIGV